MINKETIISSFDDKSTLLKWLKKVEDALKNASAVSFNVNKRGDATLTFSIVFDDGSEIESNPIVLQQGESVESAAIVNGHLILTLTNGDELDAGALFSGNVSISGNLAVTGTISGKTPTLTADEEEIKALKPVVEDMTGYSAGLTAIGDYYNLENVFIGAVKNGNKLTFVVAVRITRTAPATGNMHICYFSIPASVGAKLYPVQVGGDNYGLAFPKVNAMATNQASVEQNGYMQKFSNERVDVYLLGASTINNLALDTPFYVRLEFTFLLSDNLAA